MHAVYYAGVQRPALEKRCACLTASRQRLEGGLFHFDVQEAQRVEAPLPVGGYARVEAIWPPAVREEHYRYCLQQAGTSASLLIADAPHHSMDEGLLEDMHHSLCAAHVAAARLSALLSSLPTIHKYGLRH